MPRLILILLLVGRAAWADRVLLVDSDPELLRALEVSLAPWQLTIIVDARPLTEATAAERAGGAGARFLVWRDGADLVVYDQTTRTTERRPARAGAFDNVSAAAAALTVKTLMRLPPPPDGPPPPPPGGGDLVAPAPARDRGLAVRVEAGGAGRVSFGTDGAFGGRLVFGAMLQPSAAYGWRAGVRADLGTATSIDRGNTTGTWSDWSVLVAGSYTLSRGAWELEPWVGLGVTRGALDVSDTTTSRQEGATLFAARAGVIGRRRFGSLTIGLDLELAITPGAPVYTRETMGVGSPALFEVPNLALVFGIVVAADLGG
ncbi:MAG: hypothetical protein JNL83_15615 [Myxococcales bacterium]|nr:hypothetical protein [Myxococcales bacterium]